MRRLTWASVPFLVLSVLPAKAAPNVPLCLAIQKNFADCQSRQEHKRRHWEWERYREYQEWGEEGAPLGYDGPPDEGCAAWIVALKANNCF
jgi:hypothetical protein